MRRPVLLMLGLVCGCGGPAAPVPVPNPVVVREVTPDAGVASAPVVDPKKVRFLPLAEALPVYRTWAVDDDPAFAIEGLTQLAWAQDELGRSEAEPWCVRALAARDHSVRATAARVIDEVDATSLKPALLKALAEATPVDRATILWTLVTLGEASVLDAALQELGAGTLDKVERLDGSTAFNVGLLAGIVPPARATALAASADPNERHLGIAVLARNAATTPPEVTAALASSDAATGAKLLDTLASVAGGKGLVHALGGVPASNRDKAKYQRKAIFDRLKALGDRAAADPLARYLETKPEPHWKTEAALRLAEIGDLRAVPVLAWRMDQDPLTLYRQNLDPEYRNDDQERVVSARMLADLALLYPDQRAEIRRAAYGPVRSWITTKPYPHANGIRFMASSDAKEALPLLRKWANPSMPFPRPGDQSFPMEWGTAQSALRYLGWMKDAPSWSLLEAQLVRRPQAIDATMESLLQGGLAVLGMTLRAVGTGAAQGFAQWGDGKAYPLLVKYIEDRKNNEQSRVEACFSLAHVAAEAQMSEIVAKVKSFSASDPKTQMIRACYLETLNHGRLSADAAPALIDLLDGTNDLQVNHQLARALGRGGLGREASAKLFARLSEPSVRADAALALLLGADPDTARLAVASFEHADPTALEELKVLYDQTFGYWSDADLIHGNVGRWIANAEAASRTRVHGQRQNWPQQILARALHAIDYDNGPRSMTRVQLRVHLFRELNATNDARPRAAARLLRFMNDTGALGSSRIPSHVAR